MKKVYFLKSQSTSKRYCQDINLVFEKYCHSLDKGVGIMGHSLQVYLKLWTASSMI